MYLAHFEQQQYRVVQSCNKSVHVYDFGAFFGSIVQ